VGATRKDVQLAVEEALEAQFLKECKKHYYPTCNLTFDDGYDVQYDVAKELANRGIKATFFVITGRLDTSGYLTSDQVKEMAEMGHEIAGHSKTHPDLTGLTDEECLSEIKHSKSYLEGLGLKVKGFSYPHGYYASREINYCKRFYEYARTAGAYSWDELITHPRTYKPYRINPTYYFNELDIIAVGLPYIKLYHDESFSTVKALLDRADIASGGKVRYVTMSELLSTLPNLAGAYDFSRRVCCWRRWSGDTGGAWNTLFKGTFYGELSELILASNNADTELDIETTEFRKASIPLEDGTGFADYTSCSRTYALSLRNADSLFEALEYDTTALNFALRLKAPITVAGERLSIAIKTPPGSSVALKLEAIAWV